MLDPVTAEVAHVAVHVTEIHRTGQIQIQVADVDLIQRRVTGHPAFFNFNVAEEVAQIQIVFVHGFLGVALNGLVVDQEVAEQLRSGQFVVIMVHGGFPPPLNSTKFLFC